MGAWIETVKRLVLSKIVTSHPMWVHGLKRSLVKGSVYVSKVAPYVGAWIETASGHSYLPLEMSHPMWVRGLKLNKVIDLSFDKLSHPMWVRGLKLDYSELR